MKIRDRMNGEINTAQHAPLEGRGTPISAFSRTGGGGPSKDGSDQAAEAVRKMRGRAGTDDGEDAGDEPAPRKKPKKSGEEKKGEPKRRIDRSERDEPSPDDSADDEADEADEAEDEDDGDDEAEESTAPAKKPKAKREDDEDDQRTKPNADYSKRADDADAEGDADEDDGEEADEHGKAGSSDPHNALVEQYRAIIAGKAPENNQQNNGQQVPNGSGQRPPVNQNPPQQQANGHQQGGGEADELFTPEELQAITDDGSPETAKFMKNFGSRLSNRLSQLEQLLGIVSTDAIERLQTRKVRTATEDNKFFKAADSPYAKSFKEPGVRQMVAHLASRIQRDQMSRADEPVYMSRDEALAIAARTLIPGVEQRAERHKGRKEVEDRIKTRHRGLSIAPSGGHRSHGGGGNGRGTEVDSAAAAIAQFRAKRGIT
jgi:hypothetical protein